MSGSEQPAGRERVLAHLREAVLSDPGAEGTYINEERIAQAVGVSRTPVREALMVLASEGLVDLQPRRGALVVPLTGRQIRELMDLRGLIERHAAQVSLARQRSPHAAMAVVVAEQRAVAGRGSDDAHAQEFIVLDRRFHQLLVDAAGSTLLSQTYAGLRDRQVRVEVAAMHATPTRWVDVCTEHLAICEALSSGDPHAAARTIDEHLEVTLHSLLDI